MELKVIEFFAGMILKFMGMQAERKKQVAESLENIAEMFRAFVKLLDEGATEQKLYEYISKTAVWVDEFVKVTKGALDEEAQKKLADTLAVAFNAKQMATDLGNDRKQLANTLSIAAGIFSGHAETLKASLNKIG